MSRQSSDKPTNKPINKPGCIPITGHRSVPPGQPAPLADAVAAERDAKAKPDNRVLVERLAKLDCAQPLIDKFIAKWAKKYDAEIGRHQAACLLYSTGKLQEAARAAVDQFKGGKVSAQLFDAYGQPAAPRGRIPSTIEYLMRRGRIKRHQYQAGVRYREAYQAGGRIVGSTFPTGLAGNGWRDDGHAHKLDAGDELFKAEQALRKSSPALAALAEMVLGCEVSLSDYRKALGINDRAASRMIKEALALLAKHWGMDPA